MFKTYVSPHIGGLELTDALALAANVLSGKEAKPDYTEADLDSFYSGLSEALFLSDKSEDELEYELISDEKRATLAPVAAAEEEGEDNTPSYDEDAAYAAFLLKTPAERYALLSDTLKSELSLSEYSALAATTNAAAAVRKKLGLKTYRLSLSALLGDVDIGAKDFSMEKTLEQSLSSLDFNFDTLAEYDVDNAAAATNDKFTTFSVKGKEVSAFINDVISYFLSAENSPMTSYLKNTPVSQLDLSDYFKIASVTIMNTPLATQGDEALFDQKDTALGLTISLKVRDLVKAALKTDEVKKQLSSVPSFAVNLIPSLVPKYFSMNATIYPLATKDDGRELVVSLNKGSEKNAKRLTTLLNALLAGNKSKDSETFLGSINDQVVSVFTSINKTVKINFVPSKDGKGNALKDSKGNSYSEMKIMTWETVLSLIDKEGKLSAHEIFTMLKCLYVSTDRPEELSLDAAIEAFESDMSSKYGIGEAFLKENNLLSSEVLGSIMDNIDLKSIDYEKSVDQMKVQLSAEAIASLMTKLITEKAGDGESTAAAEEDSSDILAGLDPKVCGIEIKKVSEKDGVKIFSFELIFSADLAEMLKEKLPTEGIADNLSRKILPKQSTYFGVMLYLSEYLEDDRVMHAVGKNIDNPAEGETSAYASKIRINDFSYEQTNGVFEALNTFMESVSSGSSFDLNTITAKVEDYVGEALDMATSSDLGLNLYLYESNDTSNGGIALPSLYEVIEAIVKPKLGTGEAFTAADAKDVLYSMYKKSVDMTKTYADGADDAFIGDVNDKYYIKDDENTKLTTSDLFGSGSSGLSSKISASSIDFERLYKDTRAAADLRISLTGGELAALVKDSNLISADMLSGLGSLEILGASFTTEEETTGAGKVYKTYLTIDLKFAFDENGSSGAKYKTLLPDSLKIGAKVLLYATSYGTETRFSSSLVINDEDSSKIFLLMHALGGDSLSSKGITDKLAESISTTFNTLEGIIPLYYSDAEGGFTVGGEGCIKIADVFTFLVKETTMTDSDSSATDPDALAARLRGFGKQLKGDTSNTLTDYAWMGDNLKIFVDTDDDYVYTNMQNAYFMNDKPSPSLVYDGFAGAFSTITDSAFNLNTNANGLFYYDGDVLRLKISDKALGVLINANQSFASAVTGEGIAVEFVSFKIDTSSALVLESGIKIKFTDRTKFAMMPQYFFAIARTEKSGDNYVTSVRINDMTKEETEELFANINSLTSKGMSGTSSFDKTNIENTINTAISTALGKFPASITFGAFTAEDLTAEGEYGSAHYSEEDHLNLAVGDGYVSFPSIYSYLIDILYSGKDESVQRPTEKALQGMLVSLHAADNNVGAGKTDDALRNALLTNEKDSDAYYAAGFTENDLGSDMIAICSDKKLASEVSDLLASVTLNDNLSLEDALQQMIVLPALAPGQQHAARGEWESKFFATGTTYESGHKYVIATAEIDLPSSYVSSSAAILPSKLWFTVLADLDDTSKSKGLLYNMTLSEMNILEEVLTGFDIDGIAKDFADAIYNAINNDYASGKTITYKRAEDDTVYYESFLATDEANKIHTSSFTDDIVGYIVIS